MKNDNISQKFNSIPITSKINMFDNIMEKQENDRNNRVLDRITYISYLILIIS